MLKSSAMHLFVVRLHSAGCILIMFLTQMQGHRAPTSFCIWTHSRSNVVTICEVISSSLRFWLDSGNGNFCMCSWQQICTRRLYILLSLIMTIWMFCCSQKHRYTLTQSGHVEISLDLKREKREKKKKTGQKKSSTILKAYTQPPLFPHWFNTNTVYTKLGSLREHTLSDQNNETTGLWKKVFSVNVEWTLEGFHLAHPWFI